MTVLVFSPYLGVASAVLLYLNQKSYFCRCCMFSAGVKLICLLSDVCDDAGVAAVSSNAGVATVSNDSESESDSDEDNADNDDDDDDDECECESGSGCCVIAVVV